MRHHRPHRSRLTSAALAICAALTAGCGAYGFTANQGAGRAPAGVNQVAVATVAAPAHEGVDHGAITRSLVDEVAACSGRGAKWGAATSGEEVTLDCRAVSILGDVSGRAIDARVTALCVASLGEERAERSASARAGAQSPNQGQAAARAQLVSLALGDASRRAGCGAIIDLWNQLDKE